jgi:hypothetical protein
MQEAAMKGWPKEKYLDRRKVIMEPGSAKEPENLPKINQ